MQRSLRIFFCGEGIALAAAIDYAQRRGHVVSAVYSTSPDEAAVMRRSGMRVADPGMPVAEFASGLDYELLLSINNGCLLQQATIRRARVAAINYHNGPLPAYAGLRATAWAVLNGELQHGITWHLIEPGIDTGNVILQRRVTLSRDETTAGLNGRCTQAAVASLAQLFSRIEEGSLSGAEQDFKARSYYRRSDTAPSGGVIDWRWEGARILRLVRACDWGGVANDFGTATIVRAQGNPCYAVEGWFDAGEALGMPVPGTVVGRTGDRLRVACADGVVTLRVAQAGELAADEHFPTLDGETLDRLGETHRTAIAAEPRWLGVLRALAQRGQPGSVTPCIAATAEVERARLLEAVERVLGGGAAVAVRAMRQSALLFDWYAVRAGAAPAFDVPAPLRDVGLRQPGLSALGDWWNRCDFVIDSAPVGHEFESDASTRQRSDNFAVTRNRLVLEAVNAAMTELASEKQAPIAAPVDGVLQMLHAQAAQYPGMAAIEDGDRVVTRRELVERGTAIASRLTTTKLRRRAGVGVLLPRGANHVIASLGAMLAGGAYVPLHLESPDQRRIIEIAEAGITHLITDRTLAASLPVLDVKVLYVDAGDTDGSCALPRVGADESAYRIFTSGSTGRPKAVDVSHAALANLICHYRMRLVLGASDRMTFLSHPTFDASVADVWPVLCAGGTLLIPPPHILLDPLGLVDWLHSTRATVTFVPTAIGSRLIGLPWPEGLALRALLLGGEKLHHRPASPPPFELINTYGPTENTVDSLWAVIGSGEGTPPIGTPISGVTAEVVGPEGEPLAPGEVGELVLGGRQLARGYFGRPDLTAQRFELDASGARRYRTGDLVRLNRSGEFEFLGRVDHQVQMRGMRIEPGEIESILHTDARVCEAVCVPEHDGEEVSGLAVHVVAAAQDPQLADDLKALLAAHLVPALVPGTIVICDDLPRTAAGKTDRIALARQSAPAAGEADVDDLDRLWRNALPRATDSAGSHSFWEMGGTSLGAMKLLLAVHAAAGVRIPIASFLSAPTLTGLKALVNQRPAATVVTLRKGVGVPLVLWYSLSGDLEQYRHLIDQDLGGRPVLGVLSPVALANGKVPDTLEEAAQAGLLALESHGLARAPAMLGYSWGGLLAFEAARQLALAGNPPSFLGLIGTHPPLVERGRLHRTLHFLRWMPVSVYRKWRRQDEAFEVRPMLRRLMRLVSAGGATPPPIDWPAPSWDTHVQLGYRYRPRVKPSFDLFLVRDLVTKDLIDRYGYIRYDKPDFGWARWTHGRVTVNWLPGDHLSIALGTQAKAFAAMLRTALAPVDAEKAMQESAQESTKT